MTTLDLDLVTLTGTFTDSTGAPRSGFVAITPEVRLVSQGADVVMPVTPKLVPLDAAGHFTVDLPATDDEKAGVTGWTYAVEVTFTGYRKPAETYHLSLPAASVAIDLSDVVGAGRPSYGTSREIVPLEVNTGAGAVAEAAIRPEFYPGVVRFVWGDTGELMTETDLAVTRQVGNNPYFELSSGDYYNTPEAERLGGTLYTGANTGPGFIAWGPGDVWTEAVGAFWASRQPSFELCIPVAVGGQFTLYARSHVGPVVASVYLDGALVVGDHVLNPYGQTNYQLSGAMSAIPITLTAGVHWLRFSYKFDTAPPETPRLGQVVLVRDTGSPVVTNL